MMRRPSGQDHQSPASSSSSSARAAGGGRLPLRLPPQKRSASLRQQAGSEPGRGRARPAAAPMAPAAAAGAAAAASRNIVLLLLFAAGASAKQAVVTPDSRHPGAAPQWRQPAAADSHHKKKTIKRSPRRSSSSCWPVLLLGVRRLTTPAARAPRGWCRLRRHAAPLWAAAAGRRGAGQPGHQGRVVAPIRRTPFFFILLIHLPTILCWCCVPPAGPRPKLLLPLQRLICCPATGWPSLLAGKAAPAYIAQ